MAGLDYEEPLPNSRQNSVLGASINEGRRGGSTMPVDTLLYVASGNRAGNSEDDEVEDDETDIGEGSEQMSPEQKSKKREKNQKKKAASNKTPWDFDLSDQKKLGDSPISKFGGLSSVPGSRCFRWYKDHGPVKHRGYKKAADEIMKRPEASRFEKHTLQLPLYDDSTKRDGNAWIIGVKHGCSKIGDGNDVFHVCGCSEIWCPGKSTGKQNPTLFHPNSTKKKCYSTKAIFGCYKGKGNVWLDGCGSKNPKGFAPAFQQLIF